MTRLSSRQLYWSQPILITMVCLFTCLLPCVSLAQTRPSANLLISSWKTLQSDFSRQVHSYRLEGQSQNLVQDGRGGWNTLSNSWTAINSEPNQFSWKINTPGLLRWGAYDGQKWYYLVHEDDAQGSVNTLQILQKSDLIAGERTVKDQLTAAMYTQPNDLGHFLENPWQPSNPVPLSDLVQANAAELAVTGPEEINGQSCYRIHIVYKPSQDHDVESLPQDIWFASIENRFVPWEISKSYANGNARTSIGLIGSQLVNGAWLPTGYDSKVEGRDGAGKWRPVSQLQAKFSVFDINKVFPDSAFRIKAFPNAQIYIDGTREADSPLPARAF